jgi:hypothetical protein
MRQNEVTESVRASLSSAHCSLRNPDGTPMQNPHCRQGSNGGREIGDAYQRECITFWRRRGFNVISFNSRAEIGALLSLGYEVIYREVEIGRPRLNDFFSLIKEEPAAIGWIVNADCIMVANDQAISLVLQSARLGLVLMERTNIGAEDVKATGLSCNGFNFFSVCKAVLVL